MNWLQNPIKGTISDHTPREIILWNIHHQLFSFNMTFGSLEYAVRTGKLNKREDIDRMHYYTDMLLHDLDIALKYTFILNCFDKGITLVMKGEDQ